MLAPMDTKEILRKAQYKRELRSAVLNAPVPIGEEFMNAGLPTSAEESDNLQFTILFVKDRHEAEKNLEPTIKKIQSDSVFWVAYPKGGSSIRTDLNRDKLWSLLEPLGYRPVSQIAIDNDWSALRFRPIQKVSAPVVAAA